MTSIPTKASAATTSCWSHEYSSVKLCTEPPRAKYRSSVLTGIRVVCAQPLHVKIGDRVILRDHDLQRAVDGGQVVDLEPPARRRSQRRLARLAAMRPEAPQESLLALCAQQPVEAAAFGAHWNLPLARVQRLGSEIGAAALNGHLLHPQLVEAVREPPPLGPRRPPQARTAQCWVAIEDIGGMDATAKRLVLGAMTASGEMRFANGRYALSSHRVELPPAVTRLFAAVEASLDSLQPPSLGDIAKRLRRPFAAFEREMRALPAFGLAVRVSDNRYYLPARLTALADIAARLDAEGPFTVRQFRDASGVGRRRCKRLRQ